MQPKLFGYICDHTAMAFVAAAGRSLQVVWDEAVWVNLVFLNPHQEMVVVVVVVVPLIRA